MEDTENKDLFVSEKLKPEAFYEEPFLSN